MVRETDPAQKKPDSRSILAQSVREHPATWVVGVAALGVIGVAATGSAVRLVRRYRDTRAAMNDEEARVIADIVGNIGISDQGEEKFLLNLREALNTRHHMSRDDVREWLERAKISKARLAKRSVSIPHPEQVVKTFITSRDDLATSIRDTIYIRNLSRSLKSMDPGRAAEALAFFGLDTDNVGRTLPIFDAVEKQMRLRLINGAVERTRHYVARKASGREKKGIEAGLSDKIPDDLTRNTLYGDDFLTLTTYGGTINGYIGYSLFDEPTDDVDFEGIKFTDLNPLREGEAADKTILFRPPVMYGENNPDLLVKLYKGAVDFCRESGFQTAMLTNFGHDHSPFAEFFSQETPVFNPGFFYDGQGVYISHLNLNVDELVKL